jgi:hypothetical protein
MGAARRAYEYASRGREMHTRRHQVAAAATDEGARTPIERTAWLLLSGSLVLHAYRPGEEPRTARSGRIAVPEAGRRWREPGAGGRRREGGHAGTDVTSWSSRPQAEGPLSPTLRHPAPSCPTVTPHRQMAPGGAGGSNRAADHGCSAWPATPQPRRVRRPGLQLLSADEANRPEAVVRRACCGPCSIAAHRIQREALVSGCFSGKKWFLRFSFSLFLWS